MSQRGVIILVLVVLFVVGYTLVKKENALFQKKMKAAREEQHRCEARNERFKITVQREFVALPPIPKMWERIWTDAFDRVREGQSEADVEETLGQPLYTRCNVNQAGDKFEGAVWQYTIWLPPDMQNNLENNTIQIEFGPDGKVEQKSMRYVEKLYMKPSPSPSAAVTSVNKR